MTDDYGTPTIKRLSFNIPEKPPSRARNQREDLIEQIVARAGGTETQKRNLAKRIALWANTTKATTTDLHALLRKADDRTIRNYGGFINWSITIKKKV